MLENGTRGGQTLQADLHVAKHILGVRLVEKCVRLSHTLRPERRGEHQRRWLFSLPSQLRIGFSEYIRN